MAQQALKLMHRDPNRTPTPRDLAAVFFRQRRPFLWTFLIVLFSGLFYAALFPSYRAEMKLVLRRGRLDPAITPSETPRPFGDRDEVTEDEINSEADLLRDDDILQQVVRDTGLGNRSSWLNWIRGDNPQRREARESLALARKLRVEPVRKSHLITVAYSSSDPKLSAAVLQALSTRYLARHVEMHRPAGQRNFFDVQMQEARRALNDAEAQLLSYTRGRGVVSAPLERDLALQKVSDAESAQSNLQTSIAEAAERIRALEVKIRELPERRVSQVRNADNPQLQEKLKSKLLELQLKRTTLLVKFQPSYRLVQEVDQEIAQAKAAIEAEDLKPLRDETTERNPEYEWAVLERDKDLVELQGLLHKKTAASGQLSAFRLTAEKLGESALGQSDLEQRLKTAQEKLLLYTNKREEARIGDALDDSRILNAAVVEQPRAPVLPSRSLLMGGLLSLVLATCLGAGTAFAADYLDPSIRTPREVTRLLDLSVLASLPATGDHGRENT